MDNRTFISKLAKKTGLPVRQAGQVADALTAIITEQLCTANDVALPGFGSFSTVKSDEQIEVSANGKRTLLPPKITAQFVAGSRLKKNLAR